MTRRTIDYALLAFAILAIVAAFYVVATVFFAAEVGP